MMNQIEPQQAPETKVTSAYILWLGGFFLLNGLHRTI